MKTQFNVYLRPDRPTSGYWFRFRFRKQPYVRCLETNDEREAQRQAKAIYAAITGQILRGEFDAIDPTRKRQTAATLLELLTAYQTSPCDASAATRKTNLAALCAIAGVKIVTDNNGQRQLAAPLQITPADTTLLALTPVSAREHFARATASALKTHNQLQAASLRRTANSVWRKARSLFTPKCLEHYRSLGLYHSVLEDFVRAGDAARFSGRSVPKVAYNPPPDEIIAKTLKAWEELADHDRNLYLAIGHELSFGLRALSEMGHAQWGWHKVRNGFHCLDNAANVKSGDGWIQVKALDPWFTQMQIQIALHGWRGEPDEYIITGSKTCRTDGIFRAVSAWLRSLGWETKKTNHALRAYAGCQVAMKFGIYDAQQFLRHSTVKVTEGHYMHFIRKFASAADTLPVQWAVEQVVTKKVLGATLVTTSRPGSTSLNLPATEGQLPEARHN